MKIVKPSTFFAVAAVMVVGSGLVSCLNDPATNSSGSPMVSQAGSTVDPDYIGAFPSLAAAPDGRLHASYYAKFDWSQPGGGALRHAVRQNGVWTTEVVDGNVYEPLVDVGQFTSLAVDAQGNLHVAYWDTNNADLKYATLPAGAGQSWQIETVANLAAVCEDANLKLDATGNVNIGYCDGTRVLLATKNGADWIFTTVASLNGNSPQAKVSLQFDGANNLHIAFFDPVTKEIKYAVGPAGGSLSPVTVATIDGSETRMGLTLEDASGLPHVVFYDLSDPANSTLMHVYNSGSAWEPPAAVAQMGDVSSGGSTAYLQLGSLMDHLGRLHVSYYQGVGFAAFGNQDLKHVVLNAGTWVIATDYPETIGDGVGDVGRTSAIAEDADGTIQIIYRDSTNNDLKYDYLQ